MKNLVKPDIPFMIHCALRYSLKIKDYSLCLSIFNKWKEYLYQKDLKCLIEDLDFYDCKNTVFRKTILNATVGETKIPTLSMTGLEEVYYYAGLYAIGRESYVIGDFMEWSKVFYTRLIFVCQEDLLKRTEEAAAKSNRWKHNLKVLQELH